MQEYRSWKLHSFPIFSFDSLFLFIIIILGEITFSLYGHFEILTFVSLILAAF